MYNLFNDSNIAAKKLFVGREDEMKRLSSDFIFLTNTAVLAPRGYGKSSLIRVAAQEAFRKEKNLRFCFVDLSNVRNEEVFFELLAQGVLKAVSSGPEEVVENVKRFFPHTSPKISFDASGSFYVDIDWNEVRQNSEELLDLPHTVANALGVKMVVCLDEFHLISQFADPEGLLDLFRKKWPSHEGVSYCISATNLPLVEKFLKSAPSFYRYGEVMHLGPVRRADMMKAIRDEFADNAKYLDNETAEILVDLSAGNAFYMRRLAHLSRICSAVVCSREVVQEAYETILTQMDLVFRNITESLTTQQLCYLHAVLAGETVISTSEVLHRHHISSATSASRSKVSLLERGIVCNVDGKICLSDPIYASWLKSRYFVKK